VTRRQTLIYFKRIAKLYGVRVHFVNNNKGGLFNKNLNLITVGKATSLKNFISIFFHELAHFIATQEKKFYIYHVKRYPVDAFFRTAWRAENYVERQGCVLTKLWLPKVKYIPYYTTVKSKKFILDYYKREGLFLK